MMDRGWNVAMDAMTDLQHSFRTPEMEGYLANFARSITGTTFNLDTGEYTEGGGDPHFAGQLIAGAMRTVIEGDPVWVNSEVQDLVDHAAGTFKPQAVYLDDPFVQSAFVYFERPVEIIDTKDKVFAYRAVSWSVVANERDLNPAGDLALIYCQWSDWRDEDDYNKGATKLRGVGGSDLLLAHVGVIIFGDDRHLKDEATFRMMQKLQVLWVLATQTIAMPGRERLARPTWRRAASWKQIKEVTVLKLRRASVPKYEGDEREVEWSHRWTVSGHWRNQWYPSLKDHRQIWIAPYVKGPDDKPLVLKKRAIEFVR